MPHTFPPELLLEFIQQFPLETLLAARCVSKQWRELVAIAPIPPVRRALLLLFFEIVLDSRYPESKQRRIVNDAAAGLDAPRKHGTFDRQAYIDQILAQHDYIPDEFVIWILEWPELVIIGRLGPTSPAIPRPTKDETASFEHKKKDHWGTNMLGVCPPVVYLAAFDTIKLPGFPVDAPLPVLLIWRRSPDDKFILVLSDLPYFKESGEVYFVGEGLGLQAPIELSGGVLSYPELKPRGWFDWLRLHFEEHLYEMGQMDGRSYEVDEEVEDATTWVQWRAMEASHA